MLVVFYLCLTFGWIGVYIVAERALRHHMSSRERTADLHPSASSLGEISKTRAKESRREAKEKSERLKG